MAGDGFVTGVDSVRTTRTGYHRTLTPEEVARLQNRQNTADITNTAIGEILRHYPNGIQYDGSYDMIVDKNGVVKKGRIVTTQPVELKNGNIGDFNKPLDKVKQEQVTKFLNSIAALGLDLKAEDLMTKDGTLNPNFKVDANGNICFRDIKKFIKGEVPSYFETQNGQWAEEEKQQRFNPMANEPGKINYPHRIGGSSRLQDILDRLLGNNQAQPKPMYKLYEGYSAVA